MSHRKRLQTRTVRAALESDAEHGAVVPPIFLSSTFTFAGLNERRRYDYSRSGNPTRDALGAALAELEGGAGSVVTATGMAAVQLGVVLARPGERILAPHDCYGGTYRLLAALHRTGRAIVDFVDMRDGDALGNALARRPRIVWIETPSNPLLRVTDIAAVAAAAHDVGALVAVDNTFLSPGWQQPLSLGADLVVHSTTKYINGHSDVVGGAVIAKEEGLHEELSWWGNCLGITGSAFDAFLTLRGLRTLHARLRQHGENAAGIATLLGGHESVSQVFYPGLAADPGHALAARQQAGYGAIVSFELRGGIPAVARFLDGLECFSLAESLGGVESLVAHPDTMTHAAMEPAARRQAGITPGLLRLSVGIEALEDLLDDLQAGLDRAARGTAATG
jgi:cystathionine gamma-synthase